MKICVGIISYLPDGELRQKRLAKLLNLLKRIDELFGIPIMIVAQNYRDVRLIDLDKSNIILYKYKNGLGITGARRALRKHFLNSDFDYLIMLDDDSSLIGTKNDAALYLDQIREHPGQYGVFKSMLLKLFAISKEMYSLIDFPDMEPVNGDFFEDMYLIMALDKKYPNKRFNFKKAGLNEHSNSASDELST